MMISRARLFFLSFTTVLSSLCLNPTFTQNPAPARAPEPEFPAASISGCGFNRALEKRMQDVNFAEQQERIESMLYEKARVLLKDRNTGTGRSAEEVLTIPLVIHIVHLTSEPNPGDGPSNPSDEQILAGIEHLNAAYRNVGTFAGDGRQSNPALQSVDTGIEFCLAQRDINGAPTTGILRYAHDGYSNMSMETDDPQMQQWVAAQNGNSYPGTDYANVWLVNEICSSGSNSCNVAGYAYFPGNHGSVSNGVINRARYWGSSADDSKVHIHEFGHYLNLYHTFQGGCTNNDCLTDGDRVCDTPPDAATSYNSCGSEANSCTSDAESQHSPFTADVGDLYENYMDYSSNRCQNTFTQGQKDRMRAALSGARGSLLNSQACIPVAGAEAGLVAIVAPDQNLCSTTFTPVVAVQSNGDQAITRLSFRVMLDGIVSSEVNWSGSIAPAQTTQITLDPISFAEPGTHQLQVEILSSNGQPDPFTNNNTQIRDFQYAPTLTDLSFCEDLESGRINNNWVIANPDNGLGFETYRISGCNETGSYALGLQTWGAFPSKTTAEDLLTQSIDLSNAKDAALTFDVAYATYYSNFNTLLEVSVSTDCGLTYTTLYEKTGNALATAQRVASSANDQNAFFIPADCSEWKTESISLDQYIGQEIQLRIRAKTEDVVNSTYGYYWGNNLYLDNICINGTGNDNGGGADCTTEELVLINGSIPSGTYDNVGLIMAGTKLAAGAEVQFKASEQIVLLPGFSTSGSPAFQAVIEPCRAAAVVEEIAANAENSDSRIDAETSLQLEIAPNPFHQQTRISYNIPEGATEASLSLVDLNGRELKNIRINTEAGSSRQHYLQRDGLPAGLFLLVLRSDGRQVIRKLMIAGN